MDADTGEMADTVRSAMAVGDLDTFLSLCAEDVHWGAPSDSQGGCHNRQQVRSWYQSTFGRDVRAEVTEIVEGPTSLLVGLIVSGSPSAEQQDGRTDRWQVLTVRDGRVTDICGFDDRTEAARWAGPERTLVHAPERSPTSVCERALDGADSIDSPLQITSRGLDGTQNIRPTAGSEGQWRAGLSGQSC